MKSFARAALAASILFALPATAHDIKAGPIVIQNATARASIGQAPNSAAYMTLRNTGTDADRLVSAATPVAGRVELHTHVNDGGVMRMREVEGGIALPPGQEVHLKPGGLHVMLMELKAPLNAGASVDLTLTFEKAGTTTLSVPVAAIGAAGHGNHGHGGHGAK